MAQRFRVATTRVWCVLASLAVMALLDGAPRARAQSAGPQANSCGNPTTAVDVAPAGGAEPIFPPGQFPVQLPAKSLLGAPNNLPNPFRPGVDWGQLPPG